MSNRVPFWSDRDKARTLPAIIPDIDGEPDPIQTLAAASNETLEALMLAKMNTARNIQRDIAALVSELANQLAEQKLAELLLAQRRKRDGQ